MTASKATMVSVLFSFFMGSPQCLPRAQERTASLSTDSIEAAVSADTLPRSYRMNEPPGFIPFAVSTASSVPTHKPEDRRETSDSESKDPGDIGWWYTLPLRNPRLRVVEDPTAPVSPSRVMQIRFPVGWQGGRGPVTWGGWDQVGKGRRGQKEKVYLSMWIKIEGSGYENHVVGTKLGFLGAATPSTFATHNSWFFLKGNGRQSVGSAFQVELHQSYERSQYRGDLNRHLRQNTDQRRLMTVGSWHHWEAVFELNTPGMANGVFKWWIDGNMVMNYSNLTYTYGDYTNGFFDFNFNPTWGGTGGTKRKEDVILIDQIYISGVPMTSTAPEPVDMRRRNRP